MKQTIFMIQSKDFCPVLEESISKKIMFLPSENTLSKSHSKLLIAQILAIDNYFVMD